MIQAGDVRPGTKVLYNNEPYIVVDVTFVKPGKGGAFARTKMKNLINQLIREVTFRNEEKLDQPELEYHQGQFLYIQDSFYYFMDQESFEEIGLSKDQIGDTMQYLLEQEMYTLLFWSNRLIAITPPIHMEMVIAETTPGVRGDTAQGGATKVAKTETGCAVQVPLFVEEGDRIKIDTRTGVYIERVLKK